MLLFQEVHPVAFIIMAFIAFLVIKAIVKFVIHMLITILKGVVLIVIAYLVVFSFNPDKTPDQPKDRVVSVNTPKAEAKTTLRPNQDSVKPKKTTFVEDAVPSKKVGNVFIKLRDTYSIRYNANNRKKLIEEYPAFVEKRIVDNVTTYVIFIGPFLSEKDAKKYLKKVQESQYPFKGLVFSKMSSNQSIEQMF